MKQSKFYGLTKRNITMALASSSCKFVMDPEAFSHKKWNKSSTSHYHQISICILL